MSSHPKTLLDSHNWDHEKKRLKVLDVDMLAMFRDLMVEATDSEDDEPMTAAEWLAYCDAEIERRMQDDE